VVVAENFVIETPVIIAVVMVPPIAK